MQLLSSSRAYPTSQKHPLGHLKWTFVHLFPRLSQMVSQLSPHSRKVAFAPQPFFRGSTETSAAFDFESIKHKSNEQVWAIIMVYLEEAWLPTQRTPKVSCYFEDQEYSEMKTISSTVDVKYSRISSSLFEEQVLLLRVIAIALMLFFQACASNSRRKLIKAVVQVFYVFLDEMYSGWKWKCTQHNDRVLHFEIWGWIPMYEIEGLW